MPAARLSLRENVRRRAYANSRLTGHGNLLRMISDALKPRLATLTDRHQLILMSLSPSTLKCCRGFLKCVGGPRSAATLDGKLSFPHAVTMFHNRTAPRLDPIGRSQLGWHWTSVVPGKSNDMDRSIEMPEQRVQAPDQ